MIHLSGNQILNQLGNSAATTRAVFGLKRKIRAVVQSHSHCSLTSITPVNPKQILLFYWNCNSCSFPQEAPLQETGYQYRPAAKETVSVAPISLILQVLLILLMKCRTWYYGVDIRQFWWQASEMILTEQLLSDQTLDLIFVY